MNWIWLEKVNKFTHFHTVHSSISDPSAWSTETLQNLNSIIFKSLKQDEMTIIEPCLWTAPPSGARLKPWHGEDALDASKGVVNKCGDIKSMNQKMQNFFQYSANAQTWLISKLIHAHSATKLFELCPVLCKILNLPGREVNSTNFKGKFSVNSQANQDQKYLIRVLCFNPRFIIHLFENQFNLSDQNASNLIWSIQKCSSQKHVEHPWKIGKKSCRSFQLPFFTFRFSGFGLALSLREPAEGEVCVSIWRKKTPPYGCFQK